MTDARHDSTANAFHSTVVCLSGRLVAISYSVLVTITYIISNKKVIGLNTKSRKEHLVAQTRELACTKEVLPQVIQRGMMLQCISTHKGHPSS